MNETINHLHEINLSREVYESRLIESEERFRRIAESIHDVFWMSDTNENKVYYISPAFETVWERTPQSLYDDPESITESIIPEDREKFLQSILNQSNGQEYSIEYRILTPSGKMKYILDRGFPVYDDNQQLVRFVGVARDISLNKKYEERILQINEELERKVLERTNELTEANNKLNELIATKDKFFSIIAHDLINPFNSILNFSQLLLRTFDTTDNTKTKKRIHNIYASAESAYNLLDNLLEWARSQTGKINFKPEKTNLRYIIEEAIDSTRSIAAHKKITLTLLTEDLTVFVDFNMISTVIRNLITNAIKFTPKGGNVAITSGIKESIITISVQDNGIGMSDDIISKLFKISEKTHMPGTDKEPGSGLGLILCKEFVEMHGGEIYVISTPDVGSLFSFTLKAY